jgi:hypothetical protein
MLVLLPCWQGDTLPNWNDIQHFMECVVPWPGLENPGFVNLHYSMVASDGKLITGAGWPYKKIEDLLGRAAWCNDRPNFKGVWFCTSSQRSAGANAKGKPKAIRLHKNVSQVKAIWVDIDVKPDDATGKHYMSMGEAWGAVAAFRKKVGLPQVSAAVNSGGGLHIYWISEEALDPSEWAPYAAGLKAALLQEGIKCDAGLTTDDVRLLRMPGTFNHKYDPPREVALLPIPLRQYNFPNDLSFLANILPNKPLSCTGLLTSQLFDKEAFANPVSAAFAALDPTESLGAGIDKFGDVKLDPKPIFKQCGFMRHAFATNGADYANPLWNLSVLCTTFMENGNDYAHEISRGHKGYEPAETQSLYDRKVADRADRGIGYPACSTIHSNGCGACATCPHLSKGKSPLNLIAPVTAAVTMPVVPQSQRATDLCLPDNYDVNDAGQICYVKQRQDKEGNELEPLYLRLFYAVLSLPWVSFGTATTLHFKTTTDLGRAPIPVAIKQEEFGVILLTRVLGQAHVKYDPDQKGLLESFFMAWLDKIQRRQASSEARPFGWYRDDAGNVKGFAYGGFLFRDDGTTDEVGTTDAMLAKWYTPKGDIAPWYEACKTITQQGRMELDAIIALSFGAPLMDMLGKNSMVLSAVGESGAGKSAAFSVGLGVWGHMKLSKNTTKSTDKSVLEKLGLLMSLPFYWDEIKTDKSRAAVVDVAFTGTDGTGGDRLTTSIKLRDKATWNSLICIASNRSLVEYLIEDDGSNTAGVNRVFEYWVSKNPPNAPGMISDTIATQRIDQLRHHFGQMGLLYAQHLALNHVTIYQQITQAALDFEKDLVSTQEERLWIALCACLIVGAELANKLGASLNPPALRKFLIEVYEKQRSIRDGASLRAGSKDSAEDILTYYLKAKVGRQQCIWTDSMSVSFGRPKDCIVVREPGPNVQNDGLMVRFNIGARQVVLSKRDFHEYCRVNKFAYQITEESLVKDYGASLQKLLLGAGTRYKLMREPCIVIPAPPGSDMEAMITTYSDPSTAGATEPNPIDTGIGDTNGPTPDQLQPTDPQ